MREDIENAISHIHEFIESEDPFDGIIGFSQGGSMAAMLLLQDAARPEGPQLPFKLAVFISAFTPHNIESGTIVWDLQGSELVPRSFEDLSGPPNNDWSQNLRTRFDFKLLQSNIESAPFPIEVSLKYIATFDASRITVPTVFVRGAQELSGVGIDELLDLVVTPHLMTLEHPGGHSFPTNSWEIAQMAEMVMTASVSFV